MDGKAGRTIRSYVRDFRSTEAVATASGRHRLIIVALILLLLVAPGAAQAELNAAGAPRYGRHMLAPGFSPAPFTQVALSGGDIDVKALQLGANCLGYAARDPDFAIEHSAPFDLVTFLIASASDTTLIMNLPNGSWACNDDTNGLNPALVLHRAEAGVYRIWIGSYAAETYEEAVLHVAEASPETLPTTATGPDPAREPLYGEATLAPGFLPSPFAVQFIGGGRNQISQYISAAPCNGYVAEAPDFSVYLEETLAPVWFGLYSPAQMALLINDADGNWHCSDDSGGGAVIAFDYARSGLYDIWVGSVAEGNYAAGVFYVTEFAPDAGRTFTIDSACPGRPPTDLQVGALARVSAAQVAGVPVHSSPESATTVIYRAAPGSAMRLVGGPVCAGAQRWWRADLSDGGRGWIADGDDNSSWLEGQA